MCREYTHLNGPTFLISAYISITRQFFHCFVFFPHRSEDFIFGLSEIGLRWKETEINEEFLIGNVGPSSAVKIPR